MAKNILEFLLKEADTSIEDDDFKNWFRQQFQQNNLTEGNSIFQQCTIEEFSLYFISYLREKTEIHIKAYEAEIKKDESKNKLTSVETNEDPVNCSSNISSVKADSSIIEYHDISADGSILSESMSSNNSTPVRRLNNNTKRCPFGTSTPPPLTSSSRSHEKSSKIVSKSFSFGDFMMHATPPRSTKKKQTNQKTPDSSTSGKAKKRVVPIKISKLGEKSVTNAFGSNPTFSNDNNILKLSNTEIIDKGKCAVLEARKSLKTNASEISKELESVSNTSIKSAVLCMKEEFSNDLLPVARHFDLSMVQHQLILNRLAYIYSTLIDLNLTTNILSDLSHLLNLLNITEQEARNKLNILAHDQEDLNDLETILKDPLNCIYLALKVIRKQIHLISLLDVKTLSVILNIKCFDYLAPDFKKSLSDIYKKKLDLEKMKTINRNYSLIDNISFSNVHYQEENDSRENFSSNFEFGAFKSQRDLFYEIYKLWKSHHLNPSWNFITQIVPKIDVIFKYSENPINMLQFAKLFISQLLISSDHNMTTPSELGLTLDIKKLTKLTQRLVTPSNFSVDYQFPGEQYFFREFLMNVRSIPFMEHVKIALYTELMAMNNSTFDTLSLKRNDEHEILNDNMSAEYIVRPEVISSMQILAKFLGLIVAKPFISFNNTNTSSSFSHMKKQILMRNQLLPDFDVNRIIRDAYAKRKLLITVPWLVQYLVMLDNVTLQLDNYCETIDFLFDIYSKLNVTSHCSSFNFILKCCLGWFFENAAISYQYYSYRQAHPNRTSIIETANMKKGSDNSLSSAMETISIRSSSDEISTASYDSNEMNAMLESLLNVSCPFFAELRVSIMPAKLTTIRHASRSGRYRYITTKITETTDLNLSAESKSENNQSKLIDAFLHSQSLSMRRVIEFVIERTYSAVVKDGQMQILLPSKVTANKVVNSLEPSSSLEQLIIQINRIYTNAREEAVREWNEFVVKMINLRAIKALEALLPKATLHVIKKTYLFLICQKCEHRVKNWQQQNFKNNLFYCVNLEEVAEKIMKQNCNKSSRQPNDTTDLLIKETEPRISKILDELQFWLHCSSQRLQLITNETEEKIKYFCGQIRKAFVVHTTPYIFYRVVGAGLVQLLQNFIEKHHSLITSNLLNAMNDVWSINEMKSSENESIFAGLITIPFIRSLADRRNSFEKLNLFLVSLVHNRLITIDYLNDLFVPIFKESWSSDVLNEISNTLRVVAKEVTHAPTYEEDVKSHLFMEVLADFSKDVDEI